MFGLGVQIISVSYVDWQKMGVSGQGMLHTQNRKHWLESQLQQRGIVAPVVKYDALMNKRRFVS